MIHVKFVRSNQGTKDVKTNAWCFLRFGETSQMGKYVGFIGENLSLPPSSVNQVHAPSLA